MFVKDGGLFIVDSRFGVKKRVVLIPISGEPEYEFYWKDVISKPTLELLYNPTSYEDSLKGIALALELLKVKTNIDWCFNDERGFVGFSPLRPEVLDLSLKDSYTYCIEPSKLRLKSDLYKVLYNLDPTLLIRLDLNDIIGEIKVLPETEGFKNLVSTFLRGFWNEIPREWKLALSLYALTNTVYEDDSCIVGEMSKKRYLILNKDKVELWLVSDVFSSREVNDNTLMKLLKISESVEVGSSGVCVNEPYSMIPDYSDYGRKLSSIALKGFISCNVYTNYEGLAIKVYRTDLVSVIVFNSTRLCRGSKYEYYLTVPKQPRSIVEYKEFVSMSIPSRIKPVDSVDFADRLLREYQFYSGE